MFKLIKILNNGRNVPETFVLPVNATKTYKAGSALVVTSGKAAHASATTKPLFIAANTVKPGENQPLLAYPVTPEMVFETVFTADPTGISVGAALTLATDTNSNAYAVTATTENGVCTVLDMLGASASGDKVLVRFA